MSSVWGRGRRKPVRRVVRAWASRGGVWTICFLTSYSVVARSTECERGAGGGAHSRVREMVVVVVLLVFSRVWSLFWTR